MRVDLSSSSGATARLKRNRLQAPTTRLFPRARPALWSCPLPRLQDFRPFPRAPRVLPMRHEGALGLPCVQKKEGKKSPGKVPSVTAGNTARWRAFVLLKKFCNERFNFLIYSNLLGNNLAFFLRVPGCAVSCSKNRNDMPTADQVLNLAMPWPALRQNYGKVCRIFPLSQMLSIQRLASKAFECLWKG